MNLYQQREELKSLIDQLSRSQLTRILAIAREDKPKYLDILPAFVIGELDNKFDKLFLYSHDLFTNKYNKIAKLDLGEVISAGIKPVTDNLILVAAEDSIFSYNIKTGEKKEILRLFSITEIVMTYPGRYLIIHYNGGEGLITRLEYDSKDDNWIITDLSFYTDDKSKLLNESPFYRSVIIPSERGKKQFSSFGPMEAYELDHEWIMINEEGYLNFYRLKNDTYLHIEGWPHNSRSSVFQNSIVFFSKADRMHIITVSDRIIETVINVKQDYLNLFHIAAIFISKDIIMQWATKFADRRDPVLRIFERIKEKDEFKLLQTIDPFSEFHPSRIDSTHFSVPQGDIIEIWRKKYEGIFVKQTIIEHPKKFILVGKILPLPEVKDKVVNYLSTHIRLSKSLVKIVTNFL